MRHTALLFVLLLAACSDAKPPEVKLSDALPNIIAPPNARILSRESGEDAVKVRFSSPLPPEAIVRFYRDQLSKAPYTLVSDARSGVDGYALYAENPGSPSVWVTIVPDSGKGTFVDVAGAKDRRRR